MIKKRKVEDSPEFRYFEENFDEIIKEMEEDPELQNLKIPDEWDMRFRKTIEDTIEREEKKKNVKEKMLKWGSRVAVVAASVVLVMLVGMSMSAVTVQGEGLLDVFQKMFDMNGDQHTTFGVGEEVGMSEDAEITEIYFEASTLEDAYEKIREELKMPMYYTTYVPDGYEIKEVKYNKDYNVLNLKLNNGQDDLYISQQFQFDEMSSGIINEKEKCTEVSNGNINQKIEIYKSVHDNSLTFNVTYNHVFCAVRGYLSIEECRKIAENIEFR